MKKIIIAGGSGLIGKKLCLSLASKGHSVAILTRNPKPDATIKNLKWNITEKYIDPEVLEYDYLVNLTGAGIADKKWTQSRKQEIIESRTQSIELIHSVFAKANKKLKSVVSASAIGYYGDSGDIMLKEDNQPRTSEFLVEVCKKWEQSAHQLSEVSDQLAIIRIGTVLSRDGGALPQMDMTVPFGIANYLGNGKQWISWIHIDDICDMIVFLLFNKNDSIICNGVSPEAVTNKKFTQILKSVVNRYAILLPAPSLAIKILFGELSHLVLNSNKVSSKKIQNQGYSYLYPSIKSALENLYGKENEIKA